MALAATGLQTQIWNNQIRSFILLAGFPLLLLLMLFAFFAMSAAGYGTYEVSPIDAGIQGVIRYGHIAFVVATIWFAISFFFHQSIINMATRATPVTRAQEPHIYNLLENLCISRGITMPTLSIIDSPALNAYASGLSEKNYTITLTRGIIAALDNEELEAVLAHELTHIRNQDVRLLVISIVFVGMISLLCEMIGRSFTRGSRSRNAGGAMVIAAVVLAVGYALAIVIRFTLSRKREYMADAGSVELTKNPDAMIRALRKISGNAHMPEVPAEAREMFIENAASSSFFEMFSTHPSIENRIEALIAMGGRDTPLPPAEPATSQGPWG